MRCGRYDTYHGSKTFGGWIDCGEFIEIERVGKGKYPLIIFECENCGKRCEL